jgi:hypothetical protein
MVKKVRLVKQVQPDHKVKLVLRVIKEIKVNKAKKVKQVVVEVTEQLVIVSHKQLKN